MPQAPPFRLVRLPIRITKNSDAELEEDLGVSAEWIDATIVVDWERVAYVSETTRPGSDVELDPDRCALYLVNGDDLTVWAPFEHVEALWRAYRTEADQPALFRGLS